MKDTREFMGEKPKGQEREARGMGCLHVNHVISVYYIVLDV